MMSDTNIQRILRRHTNFEGIELSNTQKKLVLDIVKDYTNNTFTKKDLDLIYNALIFYRSNGLCTEEDFQRTYNNYINYGVKK